MSCEDGMRCLASHRRVLLISVVAVALLIGASGFYFRRDAREDAQTELYQSLSSIDDRHLVDLVERGADVNDRCPGDARTPLMIAADLGLADACRVLMRHGANPELRDHEGRTAMDIARALGHQRVLDAMQRR
jgi:uncharacterized protein